MRAPLMLLLTLTSLLLGAAVLAAPPASATLGGSGLGPYYCPAQYQNCEYGEGGGPGGGGIGGGAGCGASERFVIDGVAWIRKGECASRAVCVEKANRANELALANGLSIRAYCGTATVPQSRTGAWIWYR